MSRFDDIFSGGVSGGTVSGARKGFKPEASKVQIRAFDGKGGTLYQFTYLLADRATHDNLEPLAAAARVEELLEKYGYAQAVLFCSDADYHATCYGKLKISKKPPTHSGGADERAASASGHNRPKTKALDGEDEFLKALGIMSESGQVVGAMRDKFAQINMFIELAAPFIPKKNTVRIADFGCGKAYLTFALYHHITFKLGRKCEMTGIDLKADVLAECEALAERLGGGYDGLKFVAGDVASSGACPDGLDMVVSLHACDTATDYAIAWAVKRGASSVISVPCCQHELFSQIDSGVNKPLLRGVLRERVAALVTDAARAQLLEAFGYKAEAIEFIDGGHTAKNIMLRARKIAPPDEGRRVNALAAYRDFAAAWSVEPTLARLLVNEARG